MDTNPAYNDYNHTAELWNAAQHLALDHIVKAQAAQKTYYDARHREVEYQANAPVMIYVNKLQKDHADSELPSKMRRFYTGPYWVVRKITGLTYELQNR